MSLITSGTPTTMWRSKPEALSCLAYLASLDLTYHCVGFLASPGLYSSHVINAHTDKCMSFMQDYLPDKELGLHCLSQEVAKHCYVSSHTYDPSYSRKQDSILHCLRRLKHLWKLQTDASEYFISIESLKACVMPSSAILQHNWWNYATFTRREMTQSPDFCNLVSRAGKVTGIFPQPLADWAVKASHSAMHSISIQLWP